MNEPRGNTQAELESLLVRLEAHASRLGKNNSTAASTVNVNAGGLALWAAVTACLVMLAVTIVGSIFIAIAMSDLNRQAQELRQADATMQAYINAGLVQPKEPEE